MKLLYCTCETAVQYLRNSAVQYLRNSAVQYLYYSESLLDRCYICHRKYHSLHCTLPWLRWFSLKAVLFTALNALLNCAVQCSAVEASTTCTCRCGTSAGQDSPFYSTPLYGHCTTASLHCTTLCCSALYCTVLDCTALYWTVLHCTGLYCIVLHCTTQYCTTMCKLFSVHFSAAAGRLFHITG